MKPTPQPPPPPRRPQQQRRDRTVLIVALTVGGGIVTLLLLCAGAVTLLSLTDTEPQSGSPLVSTGAPTPTPSDPGDSPLGDDLRLEITATLVDFEPANSFRTDPHTSVRVEVTNVSDERVYVGPLDWYGEDAEGFKAEPSYGRHADALDGMYLDPGQSTAGVVTFEGEVDLATVAYQRWPSDDPVPAPVESP